MPILELAGTAPDPIIESRSVTLVSPGDRELHAPDRHLVLVQHGEAVARCSCWWTAAPLLTGQRLGVIGHYAAADAASGRALLTHACGVLSSAGCTAAAGPLDGSTWRNYRFVVDRGSEPPFFLEPDNPDDWPSHWVDAGFAPLAHYTSAMNSDLAIDDPRTGACVARLGDAGIRIRPFDAARPDDELRRIYRLSVAAFSGSFLNRPIAEAEFLARNRTVVPFVRPGLVLVAEREGDLVGYIFALPDMSQAARGEPVLTVIIKTVAVSPDLAGQGLGSVLVDRVQQRAREMGFTRAIHALMHETNVSRQISSRYGRTIRRYALYSRPL
jgi:GNAT superfamily N-acetyltransferase